MIHTPCPTCCAEDFEIRLLTDQQVGAAQCVQCHRDFLLLDSEDYWFDVIQERYPRQSRCSCKAASFKLTFDYEYRENGDVRSVQFWSTCSSCGKTKRRMVNDIKYSPTEDLVTRPLRPCKNPKIFYDLNKFTMYATSEDIARLVDYLGEELHCSFVVWLREQSHWVTRNLNCKQTRGAVLSETWGSRGTLYRQIFAFPGTMEVPTFKLNTLEEEEAFWKRNSVIRIGSPFHIWCSAQAQALLYYISYSNEYVDDEKVVSKSPEFQKATKRFRGWLESQFVSWRGRNCFDNASEHVRIFGDRFSKRRRSASLDPCR